MRKSSEQTVNTNAIKKKSGEAESKIVIKDSFSIDSGDSKVSNHEFRRESTKGPKKRSEMKERHPRHRTSRFGRVGNKLKNKLSPMGQILKKQEEEKERDIFGQESQKVEKLYIDHERTLHHHQRDPELDKFTRAMLIDDPRAYESSFGLLSNTLNVVHLAIFQIMIPSLPHSPTTLLIFLSSLELLFFLMNIIPFVTEFRFMSWFKLFEKTFKFIFMECFFGICLVISLNSDRNKMPVNKALQERGIYLVIFGIIVNYGFFFANLLISITRMVKQFLNKKPSPKKNDLTLEKRGLIYYTDKKASAKQDPEIRKKARAMSWLSFSRLRFKKSIRMRGRTPGSTNNLLNNSIISKKKRKSRTPFKFVDDYEDANTPQTNPKRKNNQKSIIESSGDQRSKTLKSQSRPRKTKKRSTIMGIKRSRRSKKSRFGPRKEDSQKARDRAKSK